MTYQLDVILRQNIAIVSNAEEILIIASQAVLGVLVPDYLLIVMLRLEAALPAVQMRNAQVQLEAQNLIVQAADAFSVL